jgi:X-Pro dipeptidyl-peptidase
MTPRALLATLLLTVPILAGCIGGGGPAATGDDLLTARGILPPELRENLTQPVYDVLGHFDHKFMGTTGVQLYVDYYRPDVPEGQKVPVILDFTPYQANRPGELNPMLGADDPHRASLVDFFVPRGYTVAFADVRGNHQAGGCIDQTGPGQWQDGYDYVEWLGTQDWSNGKVGMWGASYEGETQFTTAMMAPPHLTTIVPMASVSNQYEWNFYDGVPYEMQPFIGMFSYFTGSAQPSMDPMDAAMYPEKLECQPEQFAAGTDFSGDNTTFWQERDYRHMADQINASVLHIHGLADWNVRPIHIDPLFNDIQSEKRGIFGQWRHAFPDRDDWEDLLNAWYDHWLLGRQNGIMDILPPVLIEDSTEQWHGIDSFPPKDQPWLLRELSADGGLVAQGEASEGSVTIHDYPEEVLTDTGVVPTAQAGQAVFDHPTQVVFEFTTMEELHLVGRPYVTFTATSSAESTHWAARLVVVGDDCELNGGGQSVCHNAGYQDTRHRDGLDAEPAGPVTPGQAYELTITMYPQYDVIPAGATVQLILSNNDGEIQQDPTNSVNTILLGGDAPATLHLPLAPAGSVALPHDTLPEIYPGYLEG